MVPRISAAAAPVIIAIIIRRRLSFPAYVCRHREEKGAKTGGRAEFRSLRRLWHGF